MTKEEIIRKYLNNEKILWQKKPEKVSLFNKWDILMIPLTLIFGGSLLMYAVLSFIMMIKGESFMFSLIGITSFIIGAYILFLRLWYRKKRIKKQIYFVTDKRAFAFDTMRDSVLFDIPLDETDLYLGDKSLILGNTNSIGDFVYNLGLDIFFRKLAHETPAFKYINDINEVSKIIITNAEKVVDADDDELFI